MNKKKVLKISLGIFACVAVFAGGSIKLNIENKKTEYANNLEEPYIINEVSYVDTLYDFSKEDVLMGESDLVVIGKVTNIGKASNYNPITQKYSRARTPVELEVIKTIKSNTDNSLDKVELLDVGGTISYSDYEKSLLPAQKAKRDYLMQQSGIQKISNLFVNESIKDQLELEVGKTYIMYLYFDTDFQKYMVVNQPYGIKEYDETTHEIFNHVTKEVEKLEDLM